MSLPILGGNPCKSRLKFSRFHYAQALCYGLHGFRLLYNRLGSCFTIWHANTGLSPMNVCNSDVKASFIETRKIK